MSYERSHSNFKIRQALSIRLLYYFLAPRAYSVIMFGALLCVLLVKFFYSLRFNLVGEYIGWVLADISFLLLLEVILALVCFRWPKRWVLRTATIIAAIVCTWSVMNAGWLIRTGTQILPGVLLPLIRAPLHTFCIIGVNLIKMPKAAFILLGPSAIALTFFFVVLANPLPPNYNRKRFFSRVVISIIVIIISVVARGAVSRDGSPQAASSGLYSNCHLRAIFSIFISDYRLSDKPERKIPTHDQQKISRKPQQLNRNVVIVILEGIQYQYSSLSDKRSNLTPYLATLAGQGIEFSNARSSLPHTTKALFALLTGRFSSASHDLAEAVPVVKPYAGIVTILRDKLNYRTAFFQSAMGNFESRPGLVYNLGFDKYWARDDLGDPNSYLGYLACDEFSMLKPITEWIQAGERPFFLTILCSVTHDPYEVPEWFDTPAKEPVEERYRQAIRYTDKFLAALDVELARLNLTDKTIFCVIGDHGEAFGEHGKSGHALIAFDEVLRIPFCLRAPFLVEPGVKVAEPVSSVDLTPTLLELLGFETEAVGFDGVNALGSIPDGRRVYFCGWMQEGPAGFIRGGRKFIYNPTDKTACVYDINTDPFELVRLELPEEQARRIADEIVAWRKSTIFQLDQQRTGKRVLFDRWLCRWTNRICSAKYYTK
ncbi:MAG: LTA synthase family protein [Phycisphaerae bacterium]